MNIILIVSDTFRYDNLGCNGNAVIDTRDLDAFARQCAVFDNCYTGSFPTIPHRTDMVTGRFVFPYYGWQPLAPDWKPVAEYLSRAGFVTQLLCDTPHLLSGNSNFHRGFNAYSWTRGQEADTPFTRMNDPIRPVMDHEKTRCDYKLGKKPSPAPGIPFETTLADRHAWVNRHWRYEEDRFMMQTGRLAEKWIEENHTCKNFFLWVDMFDVHEPWDPPEYLVKKYDPTYDGPPMLHPNYGHASDFTAAELKNLWAHYAGEVHLVSKAIGRIIRKVEETGLMDNTAVIFTADHGHAIGEHDMVGKTNINPKDDRVWQLYREVTHIPLMIYVPGAKPRRIKAISQPVDIMPTILELAGQKIPDGIDGISLCDVIKRKKNTVHKYAISASAPITGSKVVTVQDGKYSLVIAGKDGSEVELFDTRQDPGQKKNVLKKQRKEALRLLGCLNSFLKEKGIDGDVEFAV